MAHFNEILQFHCKRPFMKYFEKHYKFKVFSHYATVTKSRQPLSCVASDGISSLHTLSVQSQNFHTEKLQKQSFLYINAGIFGFLTKEKKSHTLNTKQPSSFYQI